MGEGWGEGARFDSPSLFQPRRRIRISVAILVSRFKWSFQKLTITFILPMQTKPRSTFNLSPASVPRFRGLLSLLTGHWSLLTGHWSLLTAHWSLLTGHWSLLTGHWSLLTGHCSLVTGLPNNPISVRPKIALFLPLFKILAFTINYPANTYQNELFA